MDGTVILQVVLEFEASPTHITLVIPDSRMHETMHLEPIVVRKALAAFFTPVNLLPPSRVRWTVVHSPSLETLPTLLALKELGPLREEAQVLHQPFLCGETLTAMCALVIVHHGMDTHGSEPLETLAAVHASV